jgi:hypothetical protein
VAALPAGAPPKLFQPAHGRFYLVAASLVCEAPGLPDRQVDAAWEEQVGFVLRRRASATGAADAEQAWILDADTGRFRWTAPEGGPERVEDREELFPLFPVSLLLDGRRRRIWAGLVPTSSRETFEDPGAGGWEDGDPDPRPAEAEAHVFLPYETLHDQGASGGEDALEASRLLLRDFASFLKRHHRAFWDALELTAPHAANTAAAALHRALNESHVEGPGSDTWAHALHAALSDPAGAERGQGPAPGYRLWLGELTPASLRALLGALFGEQPLLPAAASPEEAPALPKLAAGQRYVIRCVQRCPRCRPWKRDVVSAPSRPFALAPFFDPDAPARPVRIAMPADTSLAALRRFKKSVGIVLSPKLRSQMARVKGMKDDKLELVAEQACQGGQICMLSIPIITIVAMILLMVFVALLQLVFWWLPLFKICLPLKKGAS